MHGKEHWLLISLAIFGVGSLVAALAGSLTVMIAGRAIQGAGGAIFPLAIGIIRDEFPRERVAPAIGTVSAMFGIGGGSGLVLAGLFVDHGSISWIFWLSVATTALAALATWLWVPESPVRVRARIDWVGGALLSLTLLALLLPISEGNSWGWTSARVLGALRGRGGLRRACGRAGSCGSSTRSSTSRSCASVRCGRPTSPPAPSASRCSGRSCSCPSSCRRRPWPATGSAPR